MKIAIIVAAGRGLRFGPSKAPKQYIEIHHISSLERSIKAFIELVDQVVVVIHADDILLYNDIALKYNLLPPVTGGDSRYHSVSNALIAIAHLKPKTVLIHDAVRPFVSKNTISSLIRALEVHLGVIVAKKSTDSLKEVNNTHQVVRSLDRAKIYQAQTPQGFSYELIAKAYANTSYSLELTDDAAVALAAGLEVHVIEEVEANPKITYAEDLPPPPPSVAIRVGMGFDAHKFIPHHNSSSKIILAGVHIPHDKAIKAHSDGDVVLHALTDAILGSIAEGDIGMHFPDTEDKWRGASSSIFVEYAQNLARNKGMSIVNIDITILAERPKISAHAQEMRQAIAKLLDIDVFAINIKATTMEKMGFIGREEGIAAQVVLLMAKTPHHHISY
jgi:2-C-methyl-D-erythritol 4-phosphate cytidylyltransferase / 2-C-methyl-D-erythritol 2,4-cyclodiphosphate synthase